ncbi:glycosyltransferase family 2 protein [Hoeflea sp.]|uniref:glycosyltransferase family 2 protein n=1 Tax=Hoeflea sp. TaxID=1940281 RepID=UPI00374A8012
MSDKPQLQVIGGSDIRPQLTKTLEPLSAVSCHDYEQRFFIGCGIGKPHVAEARQAAEANATTIEKELIARRLIQPELYYRWLADELGLEYVDHINPDEVVRLTSTDVLLRRDGPLRLSRENGQVTVIVPEARRYEADKGRLRARHGLRRRLVVASPSTIRRAVWQSGAEQRVRQTTFSLDQDHREHSARQVLTGTQGFALAIIICLCIAAFAIWPFYAFTALHLVLTMFFSGGIILRLSALMMAVRCRKPEKDRPDNITPMPVYTLLIPLRDEAAMAPALVARIDALRWPKSLLDVKYICEDGDGTTIAALEAQNLGPECEIVRVPAFGPRTKPKALQYALQGARGSLIAIYDAEDKPAPGQLHEAWTAFREGDDQLGCLQAPLAIANVSSNWLSGLFALEYSGLFRVLIPFLAHTRMPIPLGGTSNHFRRTALEKVGGWDPYNVTEDADLGLRLYAHGYRTGIIKSATVEGSPVQLGVWVRQRTRWLKGWAQTWLVVMRRPATTFASLGLGGFVIFQLMIAGMLISALAHPLMFVFIALTLAWLASGGPAVVSAVHSVLMWTDFTNILGSYLTFGAIGWFGFTAYERRCLKRRWLLLTPAYWLLMSYAGWRALLQLINKAHLWEKTPHPADPSCKGGQPPANQQATEETGVAVATMTIANADARNGLPMERVKGIEPSS